MKKIVVLIWAIVAMSSFGVAGGETGKEIVPVVVPFVEVEEVEEKDWYVGIGVVYNRVYSTDSEWFNDQIPTQDETGGFTGILGYNFNEYIAVEGRISKTFWDRDYSDATTYSLFLKPQYPVTEDFTVYGLIGFGGANVEGSDGDNDYQAWPDMIGEDILDHTGFQWGFGLSYAITEDFSLFADYTSAADDADKDPSTLYCYQLGNCVDDDKLYDKLSVDGLTVGLLYYF